MSGHSAEKGAGGQGARMFAIQAEWEAGETADAGPIRVCCGQRHHGPVCPDGLVMCCICFNRVTPDRLAVLDEGDGREVESAPVLVDMCRTCKRREDQWVAAKCPECGSALSDGVCPNDAYQRRILPPTESPTATTEAER